MFHRMITKSPSGRGTLINHRFHLHLPEGWKDTTVYTFQGPEEDGLRHQILITVDTPPEPDDLEAYAGLRIQTLEQALQGYQELKQGIIHLTDGTRGYEVVYRWSPVLNEIYYQRIVFVIAQGSGYTFTVTFTPKTWKTLGPVVDQILQSFKPALYEGGT